MEKIRILLVDDHTLFREALNRWFESEPGLEMVAHCASAGEASEILRRKSIDVVLLDHDLGKERGFQFINDAHQEGFRGRVLMVTAGMTDAESVQALRLGASGIFLKHNPPALLAEAIRKVAEGETWLDPASIQSLVEAVKRPEPASQNKPFTERESQVLRGVFEGLSNKEIAARLTISESSVKAALQQLFQKTGVRTRSQLVRIALEEYRGQWE
jgi:two-component system, NarL family, nitrate/nitrite response regulator NarL